MDHGTRRAMPRTRRWVVLLVAALAGLPAGAWPDPPVPGRVQAAAEVVPAVPAPITAAAEPGGRRLYVAVGHGWTPEGRLDLGAQDPVTGQNEVSAGQVVVDAMLGVLATDDRVSVTAESGDHPNVWGSVDRIRAQRYDDCVSIHHEWIHGPPGAFAHWHPSAPEAGVLADRLVASITDLGVPFRADWHRPRGDLLFVRATPCRAVLVEVGRIGDHDVATLHEIGVALARAYLADPLVAG